MIPTALTTHALSLAADKPELAPFLFWPETDSYLAMALTASLLMLSVAMVVSAARVIIGPTVPDRVVALDVLATVSIGAIAVFSIATNQPGLIVVGIVVGLILFLGTAAYALFLERRARP